MKIFYIYLFISHDAEHPVQLWTRGNRQRTFHE
jgi:hypothetical protein